MPAFSCAAKLGSHSGSTVIKYKSIELTRPPQSYYNEQAVFNKEMGRSDVYLYAHSFAHMHISYILLLLHVRSVVKTSTNKTNISAVIFCKQHSVTVPMPLQGVIRNGFSSFSGTFNSRTQIIPP